MKEKDGKNYVMWFLGGNQKNHPRKFQNRGK